MKAKPAKKNRKIVHDSNYNRAQILIEDPKFKRDISKIRKGFGDLECPLPRGGFRTEEEFGLWKDEYFKHRNKKSQNTKFYEESFRDILIENDLDPENEFYREFLRSYLFFGQQESETAPLKIKVTFNKKTKEEELYIQIFAHTTQEDIEKSWRAIEKEKRIVFKKDAIRTGKWLRKNADIEIYNLSEKLNKLTLKERKEKFQDGRMEAIVQNCLSGKLGDLSFESIRRSIKKVRDFKKVTPKKASKS